MGEEVKEKKPNQLVEGFRGFCRFLYNPDDHTVFGRGGASWGKILIFYFFFYACLAAFFAVCLVVMLQTLDPNVPTVVGRTNKPKLAVPEKTLYKLNVKEDKAWEAYKKALNKFKETYTSDEQVNGAEFFQWNTDNLQNCADPSSMVRTDEFATGCFYFGLNRIYGWSPISEEEKATKEVTFGCDFVEGKTGSGNLNPEAVTITVHDVAPALSKYYPWTSMEQNGLQPIGSAHINIDIPKAKATAADKLDTYVECNAYIRDIGDDNKDNWEVLPDSSPASFEIIYSNQ